MGKIDAQLPGQDPATQAVRLGRGKLDSVERARLHLAAATGLPIGMQPVGRRGAAPWQSAPAEALRRAIAWRPSRVTWQRWWPQ